MDDPSDEPRDFEPLGRTQILARLAFDGDTSQFNELYERTAPAVQAWAELRMPRSGRIGSADDLLQEVWGRAFERFGSYDESKGNFRQWLFGFAKRVLYEWLRSTKQRQEHHVSVSYDLELVCGTATTILTRMARDEGLQAAIARFRELPDEDRRLVVERGLEGREHTEIAEGLGVDAAIVRKRWQRLRTKLAEAGLPAMLLEE